MLVWYNDANQLMATNIRTKRGNHHLLLNMFVRVRFMSALSPVQVFNCNQKEEKDQAGEIKQVPRIEQATADT